MLPYAKLDKIPYGGDYNPEQWPEEIWEEDMEAFRKAGIDIVTLNVFSWATLQRDEETYDFSKLDRIMEMVGKNRLKVCMATSTAAHPAWMAKRYPDILRVDHEGRKRKFGGRHNSCPNSPTYRRYAPLLAGKLAKRYGTLGNIIAWHVSNEFGGDCYCENCERAFRVWLRRKYSTLDALNRAWNTIFWGHTFYDWEEIVLPDLRTEHFGEGRTMFQGISLDYMRFMSDSMLECYLAERQAIREALPEACVTTNLMGFYKPLDYFKWAGEMDFVSWDNYPANEDPYTKTAMAHDLMRGLRGGEPFALMEQTPSVTNWLDYNALKRPGVMRLWSYQAVAHGADTVMFFQMRRSIGACEKYHGAVIDHAGTTDTRVFREVAELGKELAFLGDRLLGAKTKAQVAVMMDWDNWWAMEFSAGPSRELRYLDELGRYYSALRKMNLDVDIISPEMELSSYRLVIAPVLYMVRGDTDVRIREYVRQGGCFLTTFFSGIVQENDLVVPGGYPGRLRDILGIWVEEEDALPPGMENGFFYRGKRYPAFLLCDLLHTEGARQLDDSGYTSDFYRGMPVITENSFGRGRAYYVATASSEEFYRAFLEEICTQLSVEAAFPAPEGVELTTREKNGREWVFVLNHDGEAKELKIPFEAVNILDGQRAGGTVELPGKGVMILQKCERNEDFL